MAEGHRRRCLSVLALALLVLLGGTPAQTQAQSAANQRPQGNKSISMDFDQVDINVFIKFISELTGKNFVVDDKVRGKITVLSPTKISVEEAYKVFESVLEVHGFTTVPAGKVIKVVPSVDARQKSVETRSKPTLVPRPQDRMITQITPLKYADAQEIRKLLAPLVSKQGVVVAYEPTDILIITDFQPNIQRLLQIIKEIDVERGQAAVTVLSLEYASAEKLAQKLSQLMESHLKGIKARTATAPLKIVPDERINALILLADPENTKMIEELLAKLDKPTPKGGGNIQVIYLENANSEELAKVLAGLPTKGAEKGQEAVISTDVRIVADKSTNSLVITAKPEEFQVLEPIIEKLDIVRKQVYVEALIMEVSAGKESAFGVNWTVAGQTNLDKKSRDAVVFGGSNTQSTSNVFNPLTGALALPTGLAVGAVSFPFEISVGGTTFLVNNLQALITAVQTDDAFNIISTPQLMTLDNEEATVVVADNIPFSTRVDQGTATTDRAIQSLEYRDVGVTLKVTPQINEKRFVKLKIYQEVSRVISETTRTSATEVILAPTTRKRTAETNVEVKDAQTVVIAGLLEEDSTSSKTAVPCLGDIPILGWLFRSEESTGDYKNLFIFLTPYIVASPDEAEVIYRNKSEYMDKVRRDAEGKTEPAEEPSEPVGPDDAR